MIVRDVRPDDFAGLVENYLLCYDERDAGYPIGIALFRERPTMEEERAWFDGVLRRNHAGNMITLVAERDGRVLGTCSVERMGPSPAADGGHVASLGILVRKGERGGGVGSALLKAVLDRCRGRFELVRLAVFTQNDGAIRLYRRFGFHDVGTVPRAVRRGDQYFDELLMYRAVEPEGT